MNSRYYTSLAEDKAAKRQVVSTLFPHTFKDVEYLAIGFLFSEGLLRGKREVKERTVNDQRGVVRVEAGSSRALHYECKFYKDGLCTNLKGAFYRQVLASDNPACNSFERGDEGVRVEEGIISNLNINPLVPHHEGSQKKYIVRD